MTTQIFTQLPIRHLQHFCDVEDVCNYVSLNSIAITFGKDVKVIENHRAAYGAGAYQVLEMNDKAVRAFDEVLGDWRK